MPISKLKASSIASGTIDNARIPSLAASKIGSGTFADARIAASNVSQHATSFDDNKLVNDLSTLGLRVHTQENLSASNTNSQYVDVFQDSTGITGLTNTTRNSNEYVASGSEGSLATYDYDGATIKAKAKWNNMQGSNGTYFEVDNNGDASYGSSQYVIPARALTGSSGNYPQYSPGNTGSSTYYIYDFGSSIIWAGGKYDIGKNNTWGDVNEFKLEYSTDDSTYNAVDLSNITQTALVYSSSHDGGSTSGGAISNGASGGTANLSQHSTSSIYTSVVTFSGVPSITARYFKLTLNSAHGGTPNNNHGWGIFAPHLAPLVTSATGSFTSNNITAASATTKMGAVITYEDNAGTNALNTDIVLQLSADGGSNYSTATMTALPDFSTGIKMAKINDLAVTSGTSLKYKISFANQAAGSKVARIRGVSLNY